ncbi:MAG: potassium channel protein [Gemmatimonadales bacterium]|nr:potassium channel protein [Gemmatimonadales bacterium]
MAPVIPAAPERPLARVLLVGAGVIACGTLGYMLIEGWSWFDALYQTVTTVATVGFMEVHPMGTAGRSFTLVVILAGVGILFYIFSVVGESVVVGAWTGNLRRRRMQARIDAMAGHYIVCGYGRVGRQVVKDLQARGAGVVVIDPSEAAPDAADGVPRLAGDASDEALLGRAGIARAAGLVSAAGDAATNVIIVLTARALRADLPIVARADRADGEKKLLRAGATHVVSPYAIGGRRLAAQLLNPRVSDFLDLVMHSEKLELWLEEVPVRAGSPLDGRSLQAAAVRTETGATVLAVQRADGALLTRPAKDLALAAGDVLIALGTREQLQRVGEVAGGG